MKKFTDFIVNKRYIVLTTFIILSIICAVISKNVKINEDMTRYLPITSETRRGNDIMNDEFSDVENTSSLEVMFKGLGENEKQSIHQELQQIENVSSVDYDDTEKYNKDDYTLYVINVEDSSDSEVSAKIYETVTEKYENYDIETSGAIKSSNMEVLPKWIIVTAVVGVLIILLFMCESYVEPFLFLFSILIAILLNSGTNIIFDSVSVITNSISAILQLALSMDYSIMLMNRFRQEKETETDKVKAMENALYNAFKSISSSSVTTIVGLVALVFMSFTIGKDLGLVLAKGVLFSLLSIFFVLPGLILIFDKLITKTKKRSPNIKLTKLGNFSYKLKFPLTITFVVIFITTFFLKGNLNILYTASEDDEVSKIFGSENQMAIIYKNEDEEKIGKHLEEIENKEKVEEVLGYSNTINEKLSSSELIGKLGEFGVNVDIEEYLLKIIYYKYYNPEEKNTLTFDDMVKFIQNDVYNNSKMEDELNNEIKGEIDKLSNFTDKDLVKKPRNASEISNILGMEKSNIDDILVYYNSKNNNLELSLRDFVNFMNNTVLKDSKYGANIDKSTRADLEKLTKFTDKNKIGTKYTSKEMANLFEMQESDIKNLYTYYVLKNEITTELTLEQFADFVLTDVLKNPTYAGNFNEETINSIKMLKTFSNVNLINQTMNSTELSNLLGIDEETGKQVLLLKYMNFDNGTKLSLSELINASLKIKETTNYLDNVDLSEFEKLKDLNMTTNPETEAEPQGGDATTEVEQQKINPTTEVENQGGDVTTEVEQQTISQITEAEPQRLNATEMAQTLGISQNQMYQLYALIDFLNGNTTNWESTPYEFVNLILNSNNVDESQKASLSLLFSIMESAKNGQKYSYTELAKFINTDENSIRSVYGLYTDKNTVTKLTPINFVNFVLNNRNDNMLKNSINANTTSSLILVQTVMNATTNNVKYSSSKISSLLGVDKSKVDLIYGLYISKNIKPNQTMSLNEFVDFIIDDVIKNSEYSASFDENARLKLNTIKSIITESEANTKYTKDEMIAILNNLSNNVDKNTIELLYLYYGSAKEYNNEWKMTLEQFSNYLSDNILEDSRFENFINDEMKTNINDSKQTVNDAKQMLVGDKYSRVVINTNFDPESDETFNFIQFIENTVREDDEEIYLIGDSPMAYEMSKTFKDEFNYISILTMIAIFIVVAITFKSLLTPIILVAVIQSAVYMTMGILSVSGGSVYYLALLIVQSILMGSTIDYAILYTSYYLEFRKKFDIRNAMVDAYNESIHTIFTSASILVIITFIVGKFATAITAKICITLCKGTLCAEVLILLFLPALLSIFDRIISGKKRYLKKYLQKVDDYTKICYNKCKGGTQNGTKNVKNIARMEKR